MTTSRRATLAVALMAAAGLTLTAAAQQRKGSGQGYSDTPFLPGQKWRVHDKERPSPPVITPGTCSTQDAPGKAPSDAVVLFDGKDLSKWEHGNGQAPKWKVEDGAMITQGGTGALRTKQAFGDCQIHIEWATPTPPKGEGQARGNSGILIQERYEIQVLDNYESVTYADGQAASIYGQYPPLVNACRPPGQWQTYDIVYTAPRFKANGEVETPAYETVFHNGVLVHNHQAVIGPMAHRAVVPYHKHDLKAPLALQDHGNPVRYRNIWVRELKGYDEG